jgi:M6 family metalloprotease-like protein
MTRQYLFVLSSLLLSISMIAGGAPLRNYPQRLVQPDGSVVHCFASGDEFHHWLHDAQNYTIVRDPRTGHFVYAVIENGQLAPSSHVVGKVDPATAGIPRGVNISPAAVQNWRENALKRVAVAPEKSGAVGTINNIVIFIRFADEGKNAFPDSVSRFDRMFNSSSFGANSMYNYYKEVSYNQLAISSTLYPLATDSVLSYQDVQPRNYFRKYDAGTNPTGYANDGEARRREQALVARAIAAVAGQIPPGMSFDANGNGFVDNLTFILSGDLETWYDWVFWPHADWLTTQIVFVNGAQVREYDIQLRDALVVPKWGVYVLAHEMFHSLGAPDLYHYSFLPPDPVGAWDLMDSTISPPVHMSAYMKWRYGGWIPSIPVISVPRTYTLTPLALPGSTCFAIASPFSSPWPGVPSREYFVVEYRKKVGTFESSLPGEGLLVYRVNSTLSGSGNWNGSPDELYLYRPGGTLAINGTPDSAALSANTGRTAVTDSTEPSCFLADGTAGGLNISNVSFVGDSISFTLNYPLPAILSISIPSVTYGILDTTVSRRDTVVLISNKGLAVDTVRVRADTGSIVPAQAVTVRPSKLILAGMSSAACTVSVFPRMVALNVNHTGRIVIDGLPGIGAKHFEIPIRFRVATTGVADPGGLPAYYALMQNYPNPFNPSTTIRYGVAERSLVSLAVYNTLGQQVTVLQNGEQEAGYHDVKFDASSLPSGVYFYRLQAGNYVETRKLCLVR